MTDAALLLAGAGLLTVGAVVGRFSHLLHRPTARVETPQCQCRHPRALHDPVTNQCHQQVFREAAHSVWEQCTCRQYVGPEPLPSVFSPGLELPRDHT